MRRAKVFVSGINAGILEELERGSAYRFIYLPKYEGESVSLTMPISKKEYLFGSFPSFFDGLLPEGIMLEALLRQNKIDRNDMFSQLIAVGSDLVGTVTIEEIPV